MERGHETGFPVQRTPLSSLAALGLAALVISCGKDSSGPSSGGARLALSGRVTSVTSSVAASPTSGGSAAASTVKKVLVYRDFGVAEVVAVDSLGRFSVQVDRKACGLVFLDASDHVVGYLALASGISALPLMMVDSAVGQVDLANITIQDSVATPSHDPVGSGGEAQMTAEELAAYRLQSSLFSAIVRNLDMNHDGVLDVLSARPYWIGFGADFEGGLAPTSDPGSAGAMPALNVFHFGFSDFNVNAGTPPGTLLAPDGSAFGLHESNPFTFQMDGQAGRAATMYHWVLQNTSWSAFQAGTYTINYDGGGPVSFGVAEPLNGSNYIVATRGWVETSAGTVTRVHWKWTMQDGRPIDAMKLMNQQVTVQFAYGPTNHITYGSLTTADTVVATDATLTGLQAVGFFATDLFGNNLITNYRF